MVLKSIISYRKAPQHVFPTALNDVLESVMFIFKHGDQFNADVHRLVIMGKKFRGLSTIILIG